MSLLYQIKRLCVIVGFFFTFLNEVNSVKVCSGFESNSLKVPELKFSMLKSMMEEMVVFRGKDEILINRTKISEIKLECWAAYPIDFTFSGHLTNQQASVKNLVNLYMKSSGEEGRCYHINVTMNTYDEITGNYSCFSVNNSKTHRTSKYIYVFSSPPGVLLHRGRKENITIVASPNQKRIVLPCAVSNPDIQVQLHKNNDWLLPSRNLTFDPKIGFTMTLTKDLSQLGDYQCTTSVSQMDKVDFRVIGLPEWKVEPDLKIVRLKMGDRLNLTCKAQEDVSIILRPTLSQDIAKVLKRAVATGASSSYKYVANANFLLDANQNLNSGGFAACIRTSDNSRVHIWQIIVSNQTRRQGVLEISRIVDSCPKSDESKAIVLYECNNWIECRINRCIGKDNTCMPSNRCQNWACNPHGIIQCVTPDGTLSEIYFTGLNGTRYTNWKLAPKEEVLKITIQNSLNKIGSKFMTFSCEGSSFVFASGFRWSIIQTNGTLFDLMLNQIDLKFKETWGQTKSTLVSTLSLPKDFLNETANIKSVVCSAPFWNTTGAMEVTLGMHQITNYRYIIEVETPKIANKSSSGNRLLFETNCVLLVTVWFYSFVI